MSNILAWPQTPLGPLWAEVDEQSRLTALHWGTPPQGTTPLTGHSLHTLLNNYFNNNTQQIDIKSLNPKGTPFQQRVWQALLTIPHGHTVTYGQLAEQLQTSPRALGAAVGANPLPIFIPCHRVVAHNGKLTGFSAPGGITTKRWLLAHEGAELAV